jgi:hypothetical protein
LLRLLEWAAGQDFELIRPGLLQFLEEIVVESHAALHRDLLREPWSRPMAYHWIHYEDPKPVHQLLKAAQKLNKEWSQTGHEAQINTEHLAAAITQARRLGYAD